MSGSNMNKSLNELMTEIQSWFNPKMYICNQTTCEGFINGCPHAIPHEDKGSCNGGCANDPSPDKSHKCTAIKSWNEMKTCYTCKHGEFLCKFANKECDLSTTAMWEIREQCADCEQRFTSLSGGVCPTCKK